MNKKKFEEWNDSIKSTKKLDLPNISLDDALVSYIEENFKQDLNDIGYWRSCYDVVKEAGHIKIV